MKICTRSVHGAWDLEGRPLDGLHDARGGGRVDGVDDDWDKFDDIGALAGLENEGKSADGNGFTLRSGKGAVGMQCTDYVKDREEISLDEDLAASVRLP